MVVSEREGDKWDNFVAVQKERIISRISKYNNGHVVRGQIREFGRPTPYQSYKINTVTPILVVALQRIDLGLYGVCTVCGEEIPQKRLELVPAALACAGNCDKCRAES